MSRAAKDLVEWSNTNQFATASLAIIPSMENDAQT